ncbi:hypothetical protein DL93DRAFT_2085459, partial [Clavulina sp. PMI_390]
MAALRVSDATYGAFDGTVPSPPCVIVLHEPSKLLSANSTLSTYYGIINSSLAARSALHENSSQHVPKLFLFDAALDLLKLPILKPHSETSERKNDQRLVLPIILKLFEYHGSCEEITNEQPFEFQRNPRSRFGRITVQKQNSSSSNDPNIYEWVEECGPPQNPSWAVNEVTRFTLLSTA